MKVQAMFLGEYDTSSPFYLYRIPMAASPPLTSPSANSFSPTIKQDYSAIYYYCLEDLERLGLVAPVSFQHKNTATLYLDNPTAFCKNAENGYTYVNTHVLHELATLFKSSLLMDLCRLTVHTPKGKRCSVLERITLLRTAPIPTDPQTPSSLWNSNNDNGLISPGQLVKQVLHPVRLDGQEWFLQPWIKQSQQNQRQQQQQQQPLMIRLSPPEEEEQRDQCPPLRSSLTCMDTSTSAKQQSSSLLLQRRLAPKLGHHTPQLTINTPTYMDHHLHSIQSAPLRKSISKYQVSKRLQAAAAAAAAAASTPSHKPVLVPSHPSHHYPRRVHLSPPASSSTTPKQRFLQPFEHLHDTLEHVRAQKVRLDDTIRQSSTWLGKIQHSLPGMIETMVTEQMDGWVTHYTDQMQHCMDRLLILEKKQAGQQQQGSELVALMQRLEHLEQKLNCQQKR